MNKETYCKNCKYNDTITPNLFNKNYFCEPVMNKYTGLPISNILNVNDINSNGKCKYYENNVVGNNNE